MVEERKYAIAASADASHKKLIAPPKRDQPEKDVQQQPQQPQQPAALDAVVPRQMQPIQNGVPEAEFFPPVDEWEFGEEGPVNPKRDPWTRLKNISHYSKPADFWQTQEEEPM